MTRWLLCLFLVAVTAGCSDPLSKMTRLADVELQESSDVASAVALPSAAQDERPLFERLFSTPEDPVADAVDEAVKSLEGEAESSAEFAPALPLTEGEALADETTGEIPDETDVAAVSENAQPRSLFSFLKPKQNEKSRPENAAKELAEAEKLAPEAEVVEASFTPETEAREPRRGGGLFSRKKADVLTGPDAQEIAPGTPLAFGEIARVCALPKAEMGRQVETAGKYRLYDSAVGSTEQRPFFITGFDDGCPRQVTGALALFASAQSHEMMRYGAPWRGKPYSETDKAYEAAKKDICGVGKGKPCGAKMGQLEKTTAFITVYDRFVDALSWRNVLLHDGAVLAME